MSDNKRWYDLDPTISLAVSIIRNANEANQALIANFIIEQASQNGIIYKKEAASFFDFIKKRWYDSNDKLYEALECIRNAPIVLQKKLAVDAINYLCSLDKTLHNELV
jgi:hypothetical protein